MKKTYEKPYVEKVEFDYSEQVVANSCTKKWTDTVEGCGGGQLAEYMK